MSCAFHSSTGPGWQKWRQCAVCELGWQGERRLLLYTSPTAAARGSDSRRSLPRVAAQSSRIARGQPSRPVLELPRSACVHTRAALAERRYIEHQSIDATMAQSSPSTVSIISIAGGGKCIAVVGELGGERVAPHGCALFSHALTVTLITHRHPALVFKRPAITFGRTSVWRRNPNDDKQAVRGARGTACKLHEVLWICSAAGYPLHAHAHAHAHVRYAVGTCSNLALNVLTTLQVRRPGLPSPAPRYDAGHEWQPPRRHRCAAGAVGVEQSAGGDGERLALRPGDDRYDEHSRLSPKARRLARSRRSGLGVG